MIEAISHLNGLGGRLTSTGLAQFSIPDQRFVYTSAAFAQILGIEERRLLEDARCVLQLLAPEDLIFLKREFASIKKGSPFSDLEIRLSFKDGTHRYISCEGSIEQDGMVLMFVKDITHRRHQEDYLLKISAQKDTLLDMLTHNLNGPLFVSRDMLNSLKKKVYDSSPENTGKLIGLLQHNTEHCIDVINDFLKKEHFESMQIDVRPVRFDVIEKVNITLEKLREMNEDKMFVFNEGEGSLLVYADAVKFLQTLHNVLSNAIKFTDPNGTITITVKSNNEHFIVSVADNGPGVSEHLKTQLFLQKVQGQEGRNGEKSSGLGLSIAKKLVDLMSGRIWYESEPGKGSIFHIQLPRH